MTDDKRSDSRKRGDYSVVFKKLEESRRADDSYQTPEDVRELDEIRKLRDIVMETTSERKNYFSST